MKTRYIAAYVLLTSMGAWPLAHSAPPIRSVGTQVTQFRSTNDFVNGTNGCVGNVCVGFAAQVFDDFSGVTQAIVSASFFDLNTFQFQVIQCSGPAYANSLFLVQGNGNATVRATLDPSAVDCSASNVSAPIGLDLVGRADGTFHVSNDGFFTNDFGGQIIKGRSQSDQFSDTFNGTIGSVSGTFTGSVGAFRNSQLEQVK